MIGSYLSSSYILKNEKNTEDRRKHFGGKILTTVLTFFFVWPSDNSYGWLFDFKFRTESGWNETPVSTVWPTRSLSAPLFTPAWLQGLPASRKRQSRAKRGTIHFLKLITPPARQVDDGCLDFWEVRGPSFTEYWISFISVINLKLITEAEVWPSWAKSAVSESHMWKDISTSEAVHALLIFLEPPASWPPGNISRGGSNLEPESGVFFFCCYVFSKENKRLQHFSNSEGKSKSNYDVIHPGKMKWQIYHFVQNSRVCLFFYPALEVFIFLFSVQLQWNIYSPGMNSQCFPSVCFSQIIRDSGMVCSGKGMVFCGDRWVFSNDSTCLSASQASLGGLSPQTSQLLAYFSQFSQLSSCDRLHLGQISIIAKIVFLCISFFCAPTTFSHTSPS